MLEPTGIVKVAIDKINKYAYRKEFGLSAEEYESEPLEDLQINSFIMSINAEIQNEEMKKAERSQTS